jgi:drug/metabolite transporter (DMT)-like permease
MLQEPARTTRWGMKSEVLVAVVALVIVNCLWGLSFPIMKSLNQRMEHCLEIDASRIPTPLHVAFTSGMIGIRFSIAFLALCLFCPKLVRRTTKQEWLAGTLVGLLFYLGLVLQVMGLATIPASRSGFLTSLTAVFTPILSALILRKVPSRNVAIGVAIALLGVAILTGFIERNQDHFRIAKDALSRWTVGDSLTTLGSLFFTGQLLLVDYYGRRLHPAALTSGMFVVVSLASCITFFYLNGFVAADWSGSPSSGLSFWGTLYFSPMFFGLIVFLALCCSVLAFLGMNKYQPSITAVQASVIYSSEPVFASLWALVLPGLLGAIDSGYGYANEVVSVPLFLGGLLILVANVVSLWPSSKS